MINLSCEVLRRRLRDMGSLLGWGSCKKDVTSYNSSFESLSTQYSQLKNVVTGKGRKTYAPNKPRKK